MHINILLIAICICLYNMCTKIYYVLLLVFMRVSVYNIIIFVKIQVGEACSRVF